MSQLLQFYKSFQQSKVPAPKAAPTFEDLTIDDNLSEQQRVIRYTKSTIGLQRLVHVKKISDVAISIGFEETLLTIVPLIEPLSKDVEPVVKQHLVEQLRYLAKFCKDCGKIEGYKVILDTILPITAFLLEDDKAEVRQSASMTLVEVAQLITLDDIGQYVLTIILRLAHEDEKEEMRMTASHLLNVLAEALGYDLCRQFVIPEVVSLAEDPVFRVRKSTALNFHLVCKIGGEHELLERLMPAFVRLSKDDMYRVRRACAESLSDISKNVSEDVRLGVLVEIFLRLAQDPSKLVKQSVLQQSGMFIATLPTRAVNENILNHYSSMVSAPTGDASVDIELKYTCAFSFPAVLEVVGAKRWKDLKELYHTLAQSRGVNVKKTLAYSLHEVAQLLGDSAVVETELVSVFEEMIQDTEVVQMGVIKHLAKFLAMLPELCRVSYLPLLHDILHSTNPFNWRLRRHLAYQLPDLILLPRKEDLYRTLFPTVMILLQDPVACVRRNTFKGVTSLINQLYALISVDNNNLDNTSSSDSENLTLKYKQNFEDVISAINSFALGDKYQLRQIWCELCSQLLRDLPKEVFEENFIEGILALTLDRVCNVRIALSEFLCGWGNDSAPPWILVVPEQQEQDHTNNTTTTNPIENKNDNILKSSPWHWLLRRTDIKQCVDRLSKDDSDIYLNVSKLSNLYPDIKFFQISCRGRKIPPGGINVIPLNASPMTINENFIYDDDDVNNDERNNLINSSFISEDTAVEEISESDYSIGENNRNSLTITATVDNNNNNSIPSSPFSNNNIPAVQAVRRPSVVVDVVDISLPMLKPSNSISSVSSLSAAAVENLFHYDHTILADEVDLLDNDTLLDTDNDDRNNNPLHTTKLKSYDDDEIDEDENITPPPTTTAIDNKTALEISLDINMFNDSEANMHSYSVTNI